MIQQRLAIEPLSPHIGAEVRGIDLTQPLAAADVDELRAAFHRHLVLFFRDQPIDVEAHKALARAFGELHVHVAGDGTNSKMLEGDPAVRALHFDEHSTAVSGELWHTDQSCAAEPPLGSILYLHTVPPRGGGATMFASMYAAYDALSPRMKEYLAGLTATHVHPETQRRVIYFTAAVVTRINELPELESKALIAFLTAHCAHPNFQMRFQWTPHSIAFWDNRCVHHRAIWDYYPAVRSGYRVQIRGSAPVAAR